jgi:acyl-CoA reductase-like NAD-dependent aldehyde dehydrogenase
MRRIAPALCGGNVIVALAPESTPLPALTLAEVFATSDFPAGVVNVLSGQRKELLPWLASHMDVNAIDVAGCTPDEVTMTEAAAADNVKRVIKVSPAESSPYLITAFMEMKTVWHPIGV